MTEHRDQQIHFRVSKVELERIRQKMESCGILSIGSYLRKMALDGYCLNLDLPQLRRMAYLLQNCSNNLNQVAKRANESGQLYAADLEDLRSRLDELIATRTTARRAMRCRSFFERRKISSFSLMRKRIQSKPNIPDKQYDPENFAAYPARFSGPFLLITQSILRAAFPALSICLAIMFSSSCVIVAQFATR